MASFEETGPRRPVIESIRVDRISPGARTWRTIRALISLALALIILIPIFVMLITAFKSRADITTPPPQTDLHPDAGRFRLFC